MAADTLAASYDTNVGNRGAFNLNGGRIFDPLLVGYQEMQRVWAETLDPTKAGASGTGSSSSSSSAVTRSENVVDGEAEAAPDGTDGDASASASASASVRVRVPDSGSNPNSHSHSNLGWWPGRWPLGMSSVGKRAKTSESRAANADGEQPLAAAAAESPALPLTAPTRASDTRLPAGYVDLRVGGVGLVFDLGWRRTDAALRWEVEDVRYAAEQKRWRGAVREQRRRGGKSVDVGVGVGDAAGGVAEAAVGSEGKKSGWAGASFMGSW
ncbi:uncharacterized protein EHS24_004964 [Apiotrichum porosum]|uniref:Uncharacterized protein n=1 Tax=Apiotrichum porosum TaxID=105984 RepID=A0A427Y6G7_9TREE|nr:uncharacterized protein EHS24_004964 [Apiotrichum porosum]RSH86693.1 hypothetical protein EHS24_004964 [Apiotrichum porosum]